ncbi:helix-turn-helix transcriptional regulator [Phenylobacterium sp.]|uniref:helix-turn-helix transcriptional regulator n=1 Tax=Phenylobacterium sp. TaxID=1871053 RepID=UPI00120327EB|nr:helix-turn-helix transcriptional regulator [Phenylobacterium sp.]THD60764.1 MAG: XRE family transcriptional regulator [Phenylobacterium sp.]
MYFGMKHSTFNYIRTHRQRHALTEEELAFLINQRSRSAVSLIETGDRSPTLETILAFEIVFGTPPRELFPEVFEHVEDSLMRRAWVLYDRLEGKDDARSRAKRELFERMAKGLHQDSARSA